MIWKKLKDRAHKNKSNFMPEARFMRLALAEAAKNLDSGAGGPFGACIVKNGELIAIARNTVLQAQDATCHAEINAIRAACQRLQSAHLTGCEIYSSTEPCPMCFSAIHWANLSRIIYSTRIQDVQRLGFNELTISNQRMRRYGNSKVQIYKDFLRNEGVKLLEAWLQSEKRLVY